MSEHEGILAELEQRVDVVTAIRLDGRELTFLTNSQFPYKRVCNLLLAEPETVCWLNSLPQGACLWDVGANMGVFTLYAAGIRDAEVYAFEPEASNFALLNKNIALSGLGDKIKSFCLGLGDKTGLNTLYKFLDFESAAINSIGAEVDAHLKPKKSLYQQGVMVFRGDDLCTEQGVPAPAYIKIDVDGIEHLIINGMDKLLEAGCQSLIVELNTQLPEHQSVIRRLTEKGFYTHQSLVEETMIKSGYWEGMVNMIFHKDREALARIYTELERELKSSADLQAYRACFDEGKEYLSKTAELRVERHAHR